MRVYTAEFKPKRQEAFWHFMIGGALALYAGIEVPELRVPGLVLVIVLLVRFLKVLASPNKYALAIDTSGEASALVTLPDREELQDLVGAIVEAIDTPEKEFHMRVESVNLNRNEYHYGDKVNVYGGLNNTGVLKK